MCNIQAVNWTKNSSTYIPTCAVSTADNVGIDVTISITEAPVNLYCYTTIDTPSGRVSYYSNKGNYITFINNGTYDILLTKNDGLTTSTLGNYSIVDVIIFNETKTANLCWMQPIIGNCTTLSVTSGGGGSNLASITVQPTATVAVGQTTTINAGCFNSSGQNIQCPALSWGSGNNSVATIVASSTPSQAIVTGQSIGIVPINCWDPATGITSTNVCQVTVVAGTCTNPRYKCSGNTCISDNCDGTGIYTTNNCNNACSPSCTTPKYKCSGNTCISDNCDGTGTYTTSNCNNVCGGGGGGGGGITCTNCDITKNYCISGSCVPKSYVMIGALAFFAIMMMRK